MVNPVRNISSDRLSKISNGVNYLRLSVTDRCNLSCIYCTPYNKDRLLPDNGEVLSFEEIKRIVKILSHRGIEYVRITGGEPLLRCNVKELIRMLHEIPSLKEISMTTNGVLLRDKLHSFKEAGLDRLNISLNTFKKHRYRQLTGVDRFDEVWASIKAALSVFRFPLKINTVILKGINDDEIDSFVSFARENKVCVRFIEYFPTNNSQFHLEFIPNLFIKEKIERKFGTLIPDEIKGNGPAINYRMNRAQGKLGFINTNTGNLCQNCNRLRLSAKGELYPCLFSSFSINLKKMLKNNLQEELIRQELDRLISKKPEFSKGKIKEYDLVMSKIGG